VRSMVRKDEDADAELATPHNDTTTDTAMARNQDKTHLQSRGDSVPRWTEEHLFLTSFKAAGYDPKVAPSQAPGSGS
jgi:hypothetical protein